MAMTPFFSVVVATRNRPVEVKRALEAIAAQTFADFEVVVVDDGSSTATRGAYAAMGLDARFQFLHLGPDGHGGSGPSRARNHGVRAARGRFLAFCDDDDLWCDDGHLAVAAEALGSEAADFYLASQRTADCADWLPDLTRLAKGRIVRLTRGQVAASPRWGHVNCLIVSRALAVAAGGFWEDTPYEEDLDFYWRALDLASGILYRPDAVAIHHPGPAGASGRFRGIDKWRFRALVAGHIAALARSREVLAWAARAEGDALRHIATLLAAEGRVRAARGFARQALAARFSLKWLGYALWLGLRPAGTPPDARLLIHYRVERELAARLRDAPAEERRHLYPAVYDELFRRVPWHPQIERRPEEMARRVKAQMALLGRFLTPDTEFLELGAGDCALSRAAAGRCRAAHAVDVSAVITAGEPPPPNFTLHLTDGIATGIADGSVQVAYSNQLIEHLHPDDAVAQLGAIRRALAPGGRYVCVTPNRLNGPHDVSAAFDRVAKGLHLREYSRRDLDAMFRHAGFVRVDCVAAVKGRWLRVPAGLVATIEKLLERLPLSLARALARRLPLRPFLDAAMVATR
jgi:glycosyltransferase involved in cell wall biosynthesis/SAM-dependent methyltransferase